MLSTFTLTDRYTVEEGRIYLGGLQALVRMLLDHNRADRRRGLNTGAVVSGYPGSPVGGLDSEFLRHEKLLEEHGISFVPGVNEDLAATAVFGAQLAQLLPNPRFDGVTGMWFGKGPGVDRSIDAFRHGTYRGMAPNGCMIAVAGDDPAAKSSTIPNDSLPVFQDLMMPTVYPGDVQDILDLGLHGLALSRASSAGVGLKLVSDVADAAGTAFVGPDRVEPVVPVVEVGGVPFSHSFSPNQRNIEVERLYVLGRLELAREYGRANRLNPTFGARGGARIGIVAPGKTYCDMIEALHVLGIEPSGLAEAGVRLMKVGLPYPMHRSDVLEFADGLDEILVLEDKRPFVEVFVKDVLYGRAQHPRVVGERDELDEPLVPAYGALTADALVPLLAQRLDRVFGTDRYGSRVKRAHRTPVSRVALPVVRAGHFCSGCPHTTSLQAPEEAIVGGGIGCHTMVLRMERDEFGTILGYTQMGGEGAQWVGASLFTDTEHFFQNLGDGTFAHSGTLALRFAVAAGLNITYKLLFNSAVAMTGGQEVTGGKSLAETIRLLEAEGVRRVIVTSDDPKASASTPLPSSASVRHRDDIVDVQRELAGVRGVTVLIHHQQCAIEKRRDWRRGERDEPEERLHINERVCEGCGDCGRKSSCLSVVPVETEFGRKTQIHQSSCSKDYSCIKGDCPSFVTVKPGTVKRAPKPVAVLPDVSLPEPVPIVPPDHFELHMSGIGGTGVITVNQILGTAAAIAGRSVRALDQFGGSQKAGAVTSHLKVSTSPIERASTIGQGGADALLVFDLLVATETANLAKADPDRTVAVVSTNRVPTGTMVVNPRLELPEVPVFARAMDANTRAVDNVYTDAQRIAEALLANHLATNLYLTGIAFEKGLLPLPSEAIEHAIRLNGVAVEMNLAAFRWGRITLARPDLLAKALAEVAPAPAGFRPSDAVTELIAWAGEELRPDLERRVSDLVEYQDLDYARSYAQLVQRVAVAEAAVADGSTDLARAVAHGLHKLMAYKDEYEVARLHLLSAEEAKVDELFGPDAKVYWNLHPPILRALGYHKKIAFGPWFKPVFRMLRRMRRLRGTRLDVFGYAKVRRVERRLVVEYRASIEKTIETLDGATLSAATKLAELPDLVRGYEEVKLANVAEYEARRAELLRELESGGARQLAGV
jgi:indolepyruvate ferredoxin oxidoreductase